MANGRRLGVTHATGGHRGSTPQIFAPDFTIRELGVDGGDPLDWYLRPGSAEVKPADEETDHPLRTRVSVCREPTSRNRMAAPAAVTQHLDVVSGEPTRWYVQDGEVFVEHAVKNND